jgi:hypothetical protein
MSWFERCNARRARGFRISLGTVWLLAPLSSSASASAAPPDEAMPRPVAPASAPVNPLGAPAAAQASRAALPRQFTVELAPNGDVIADGSRLGAATELEFWARRAAASRAFAGAVLFSDRAADDLRVRQLHELLERVGLQPVRSVRRSAPSELGARAPASEPSAARSAVAREQAAVSRIEQNGPEESTKKPAPASASPARPRPDRVPHVELASVGLHVAGPLNAEPERRRLLRTLERNFGAFRRCHDLARPHEQNASYGVDLLIPKQGGKAQLQQTRTRLSGDGFQPCMQRAFRSIRFDPPSTARPEIVSYSVVFKPTAP